VFFILKHQKEKQKLQALFSQQLIETQENEKQRISRELHDSVGQNILFIKNQLSKTNTNNDVSAILETVNQTIAEVRNISKDLYPNQLEKYGLAAAIENLGEKVTESCGIFISADFQDTEQYLSKDAMIHLYRIIQEAINNAVKHAAATALRITAEKKDNKLHFLIQDNGKGFDKSILAKKQQSAFGLLSMEERVKILGGKLEIETALNQGTKLSFTLAYV
jgi:signal transduction histidine kinase